MKVKDAKCGNFFLSLQFALNKDKNVQIPGAGMPSLPLTAYFLLYFKFKGIY